MRIMPYKSPWHSIKQNVHHNNSNCNTGNNVEFENIRAGTRRRARCALNAPISIVAGSSNERQLPPRAGYFAI